MPHLQLKIVSEPVAGQNNHCHFTENGGSIGRAEGCDWTLVDNDRFISKRHLTVAFKNQQFILTDKSSNGVFVNNTKTKLGQNNEHVLQLSDKLTLGKHIILVEQIDVFTKIPTPPLPAIESAESNNNDLFGLIKDGFEAKPKSAADLPPSISATSNNQAVQQDSNLGLNEILSAPIKPKIDIKAATPIEVSKNVIPDDWNLSDMMPEREISQTIDEPDDSASTSIQAEQIATTFEHPKGSSPTAPEGKTLLNTDQVTSPPKVDSVPSSKMPTSNEKSVQQTSEPNTSIAGNDAFFKLLYEKLGLPKEYMENVDPNVFAEDIVDILLSTTSGLMSLLTSRLLFKQEARLSATLIQARSNNPIKFSIDPVDTLEMLLLRKKKGYMSTKDSYDEAINDLQLHQTAFLSGLQASLVGVLNELSPDKIKKEITTKTHRFMGLNSNSQCWQLYKERQSALLDSVNENFNDVLGGYFSDAYQAQINDLKNKK